MVNAGVRVQQRRLFAKRTLEAFAGTGGVTADEEFDHAGEVFFRAGQPVLQGQEVGAQVLRGAGDEAQDSRQPAQHRELLRAGAGAGFFTGAAQSLQQRHRAALLAVHREAAHARQVHDLGRRHAADDGVAAVAALLQRRQHRADVVIHEQHRDDDQVGARDLLVAIRELVSAAFPVGGGVRGQL